MTKLAFTADAKALRALTAQGLRAVSRRGVVAVLQGLVFDVTKTRLTVESTDMELSVRSRMKLDGAKPGRVLVPGKAFDKALSTFTGDVTVEMVEEFRVTLSQGKAKVSFETMVLDDFPTLPQTTGKERTVVVLAPAFQRAFKFVFPHSSKDESRPVLTGVQIEAQPDRLYFAATDSYRMAVTWAEGAALEGSLDYVDEDGKTVQTLSQVIAPTVGLAEVSRLLKNDLDFVEIRRLERHLAYQVGDTEVISRLIDGQFPNWRQLRPENIEDTTVVDREAFVKSLSRITKLMSTNAPVRAAFFVDKEFLPIEITQQDFGKVEDSIPIITPSPNSAARMEMGWNADFLLECLESFDTPGISIGTINPLRPALVHGDREDEYTLIMPIRLAG